MSPCDAHKPQSDGPLDPWRRRWFDALASASSDFTYDGEAATSPTRWPTEPTRAPRWAGRTVEIGTWDTPGSLVCGYSKA